MSTMTLPTECDLEMWPHVSDNSPLLSLDYAESVQDAMTEDDKESRHDILIWLFDLCEAAYALAVCSDEIDNGHEILAQLDRMQFRMSPLFRDVDDLEEDVYNVFERLLARGKSKDGRAVDRRPS